MEGNPERLAGLMSYRWIADLICEPKFTFFQKVHKVGLINIFPTMQRFIFFSLAFALSTLLSAQQTSGFFSTFDAGRGNTVIPARDGNIWFGAMKSGYVLIAKLLPSGKVLEKHSIDFQGSSFTTEHLVELLEDSDGMLVGCGNFEGDNLGRGFVFRYNPTTRNMLWSQIIRSDLNYIYGVIELGPEGNFVLYGNPHISGGDDVELLKIGRSAGQLLSGGSRRYSLGTSENFTQMVFYKGALYACGRFTGTELSSYARMRNTLCKVDTGTLNIVWTRLGPIPTSALGRLYGRDLVIHNDAIVSTFSGDYTNSTLATSTIFLQIANPIPTPG